MSNYMSNHPEAVYWLALIYHSNLKLSLIKPIILRWCGQDKRALAELFHLSALELSTTFGLAEADAERILAVRNKLDIQAAILADWQAQGLELLIRTDERYPRRFINHLSPAKQPLVLWSRGPVHLLNQPGVTMLGHDASDKALVTFVDNLAATLRADGIGLVSGYSRGLDRATYEMMMAAPDGTAMVVLPMGLNAFVKTTSRLESDIESGQTVLMSPFPPDTDFQEKLAEARNLLIDHLTLALLIPESDEVSQARANAALDRGLPVFVKEDTALNRELLDRGALLLTDPGEVIDWVQQAIVDDAIMEEAEAEEISSEALAAAPLSVTAPVEPESSNEDYSLRVEDVPPIDSEEAMEVLSMGGEIPDILRQRLEKKKDDES